MHSETLNGKTVVVKYGGNAMKNERLKRAVIEDVVFFHKVGVRIVLVHGGGPEIEAMLRALSIESRFVDGLRYTDKRTMEVVQMALCGRVNKDLTAMIVQNGVRAVGISGIDGGLLRARPTTAKDLGLVGEIDAVDSGFLSVLLDAGLLPVVSSVALNTKAGELGESDHSLVLNINADTAAPHIAAAIKAKKLVVMTDIAGVLRNVSKPESLIPQITLAEIPGLKASGIISGGMIPKIDGAVRAVENGVQDVLIIDGREEHALRDALSADRKKGTTITRY
ncbi:MAG: acetylglutamate kinase [Spirochaetaceae bacterium]|jgi:acetylglutamate kinase|nr:acetylglutamate kinase [Spirochaetaceae bacterium]